MQHIKYAEDLLHIHDPKIRDWLKQEKPYLPSRNPPPECSPDEQGWLIVLEESDSLNRLDTGITAIDNILDNPYWEFVLFNPELDLWLGVVIIDDGFGMAVAVAVPDTIVKETPLHRIFTEQLSS